MRIAAHTVGIDANAALRPGRSGVVAASFARSCYVRFAGDWVCVGDSDIGPGPLNIPCRAHAPADWSTIAPVGRCARVTGGALIIDGRRRIVLAGAPVWRPPRRAPWTRADAARGLRGLAQRLPPRLPADGLASLLAPGARVHAPVARAALPAVAGLEAWLARPRDDPAMAGRAAASLLGLGPGLTPSGDDFLAGCLAALRATGRHRAADELWAAVAAHAPGATNAISLAHLRAAAGGRLGEDLHRVLDAVLGADPAALDRAVARLSTKPHHSTWDCLAGMCTVLRAVAAPRQTAGRRRPARAAANRPGAG